MDFNLHLNSKTIIIKDAKVCSYLGKVRGLMFRSQEKSPALIFQFPNKTKMKIHSYFVSFPFLAIWLDEHNKIIEKKIVKPFTFSVSPQKSYTQLIEIPLNKKYLHTINQIKN